MPQQEAWIVERMGKWEKHIIVEYKSVFWNARYHKTLEPGMNVLVPVIDKVKYVHSLKEITVDIPTQIAVTKGRTE